MSDKKTNYQFIDSNKLLEEVYIRGDLDSIFIDDLKEIVKDLICNNELIEKTKNWPGMKQSVSGLCKNVTEKLKQQYEFHELENGEHINYAAGYAYLLNHFGKDFSEAREAFLKGDFYILANFFGIYV